MMNRFSLGDEVYRISRRELTPVAPCPTCDRDDEGSCTGQITLRGALYKCPSCDGRKTELRHSHQWLVERAGTVGMVTICMAIPSHNSPSLPDDGPGYRVTYMLTETGIGGGSVYSESVLYGSRQDAQAECDQRQDGCDYHGYNDWTPLPAAERSAAE